MCFDSRLRTLRARGLPAIFALLSAFFTPAALSREHNHDHDHADHQAHMQMMSERGYVRTVQAYQVPDVPLTSMDGRDISLARALAADGPMMLNFIYSTCTSICPVMSATFAQVQKQLGPERDKLRMVSITIDPEHDGPARLREYAAKYRAGPTWEFLTGTRDGVVAAQKAFDIYRGDKSNHIPVTFLRASADAPWVRLEGLTSAADLVHEYHQLVAR